MLAGFVLLTVFNQPEKVVFLVGIVPALLVVWIRWAVPEPEEWREAQAHRIAEQPKFIELFQVPVRHITVAAILVCATALTGHWAFIFWFMQHLRNLPDVANFSSAEKNQLATQAMALVMITSILGNFAAAAIAKRTGYRPAVVVMCLMYFAVMFFAYRVPRDHESMMGWLAG